MTGVLLARSCGSFKLQVQISTSDKPLQDLPKFNNE